MGGQGEAGTHWVQFELPSDVTGIDAIEMYLTKEPSSYLPHKVCPPAKTTRVFARVVLKF
jgi:hypothetical protein